MTRRALVFPALCLFVLAFAAAAPAAAAQDSPLDALLGTFSARALGPYRAGSWVTAFAVPAGPAREHLYTLYVGTRNGGVWKTTNNGTTFEPIFDGQPRLSIGDIAVAPSDANIVWVGTGEPYCARSSSSGDGVYKSTDAGKTWRNMGLRDSHHIARVLVHPRDPGIVYVAAMGRLFSANAERGVFKTTDGGRTWQKVLYVNDRIGAVDLTLVESAPETLYAAMYDKVRLPWHYELGGPESGVYKTTDAGATWTRLAGGLPTGRIGRIGLDVLRKNPDVLCAVVENGNRRPPTDREVEADKRRGVEPAPRTVGNEVYRSDDAGLTWRKINAGTEDALNKAPYSFNQLRLDPEDADTVYITGQSLVSTRDGGKTWKGLGWPSDGVFPRAFGDWRAMWVDPLDPSRLIFGSDGGANVSYDRGRTSHHYANRPLGEFYAVGVDMEEPYNVYGGLPAGAGLNVVVQDRQNPDLLLVGSELGVYVSIDGGRSWRPFRAGMPSVKVTDLVIHPRENDLVVATYGRGLYIVDMAPLRELGAAVLDGPVHLFEIEPRVQRTGGALGNYQFLGDSHLFTPNEPNAVTVAFYLKETPRGTIKVAVADLAGAVQAEFTEKAAAGLNRIFWDMKQKRGGGGSGNPWADWNRPFVEPGTYIVTLEATGRKLVKNAVITGRQGWSVGPFPVRIGRL